MKSKIKTELLYWGAKLFATGFELRCINDLENGTVKGWKVYRRKSMFCEKSFAGYIWK